MNKFKVVAKTIKQTLGLITDTYMVWQVKEYIPRQLGKDNASWVVVAQFQDQSSAVDYAARKNAV